LTGQVNLMFNTALSKGHPVPAPNHLWQHWCRWLNSGWLASSDKTYCLSCPRTHIPSSTKCLAQIHISGLVKYLAQSMPHAHPWKLDPTPLYHQCFDQDRTWISW
jgi:hypothetical protein